MAQQDAAANQALSNDSTPVTLSLTAAEIKGMALSATGGLVVTKTDGSALIVENFRDMAEQGTKLTLADGEIIDAAKLFESLSASLPAGTIESGAGSAIVITGPQNAASIEVQMQSGQIYVFQFDPKGENASTENGDLIITFDNGGKIVLHGYEDAVASANPPVLKIADGQIIDGIALLDSIRMEQKEAPDNQAELRHDSGDLAALAEKLAEVEPAAGENGGGAGRGGFGFQSVVDAAPLGSPAPVGPLGPTALQFGLPQFETRVFAENETIPTPPGTPGFEVEDARVYEDGTVQLDIFASSNGFSNVNTTITVSGIPAGWMVGAGSGTYNAATGTWTLVMAGGGTFNGGPFLSPPADSDADLNNLSLTVTNTSTITGLSSSQSGPVSVFVDAVADKPDLTTHDASGLEGAALPADITTSVTDTDGSETITRVEIGNVPVGFTLSAGTFDSATGLWTLAPAQLAGLSVTPPAGFFGAITLDVTTFNAETNKSGIDFDFTNDTNSNHGDLTLTWKPVVDTPDILVNNGVDDAQVYEDGSVLVPIVASLGAGASPSEFLTVTVTGIDSSWGFSAPVGTYDATTGTWTIVLAPGQNFNSVMTFTPPADADFDMTGLVATATAFEPASATSAQATDGFNVVTDAVADKPDLTTHDASGLENAVLPVDVTTAVTDIDGSETITRVEIANLPVGFTLSAGTFDSATGLWTLAPAQLAGLSVTPPAGFFGAITLDVTTFNAETNKSGIDFDFTNDTNSNHGDLTLTWKPVVDTPDILVNNGVDDARVKEDGSVDVPIVAHHGAGASGSEILTVTVTGIDSSWGFSAPVGTYDTATGTWTIVLAPGQNFNSVMTFTPPADADFDMTGLVATATAFEPASATSAQATDGFNVVTDAVIDTPNLSASSPGGEEDHPIDLHIATSVTDLDGSESITHVAVSGLPSGASLNHGTDLGGGVWQLTVAQLGGLQLTPPAGFSGTLTLSVTTYASEVSLSGSEYDLTDNDTSVTVPLTVSVTPDDVPVLVQPETVTVDETGLAAGAVAISDSIEANFFSDAPGVFGVTGSFHSAIPLTSNGVAVTVALVGNVYVGTAGATPVFTLLVNSNGTYTFNLTGVLDHPDTLNPNDSIALDFGISATDSDGDTVPGNITVNILDDAPIARDDHNSFDLIAGGTDGNVVTGLHGGPGAADTGSQDSPSLVTSVSFGGTTVNVPLTGTATINGDQGVLTISADGSYTYTLNSPGTTGTDPKEFNPGNIFPHLVEGVALSAGDASYGIAAGDLTVANAASGSISFVSEGAGYNNTVGMFLVNPDGTITAADILIQNGNNTTFGQSFDFNAGAGQTVGFFLIADGYTTNNSYAGLNLDSGTLEFIYKQGTAQERPATVDDSGADVVLVHTGTTGTETILVEPMYFSTVRGGSTSLNEDGSVRVVSGLADPSDPNTLRVGFEDLPGLGDHDFEDIIFDVTLTESCGCTEDVFTYTLTDDDGDRSVATLTLECEPPVILPPTITVNNNVDDAFVKEDGSIFVPVTATLDPAGPATQVLTVTVTGIDPDWTLTNTDGTYNAATGTWTITLPAGQNYSGGLIFAPPANSDLDLSGLNASAKATEPVTGQSAVVNDGFQIITDAVADRPLFDAANGSAAEGQPVAVTLSAALTDQDGSELITGYQISGVPTGFAFNHGTDLGGGVWSFTTAQIAGLQMTSPAGFNGSVNLTATVFNTENPVSDGEFDSTDNNNSATDTLTLSWTPVILTPDITVNNGVDDAVVKEDGSVSVPVTATLGANAAPGEFLTVTVTGIDSRWGFSAPVGTYDAATGTWTVTLPAGQNLNTAMVFTPPADADMDLNGLMATAVASDPASGLSASDHDDFRIVTDAVADKPTLDASAGSVEQGHPVSISLSSAVTDLDGSETITDYRIGGVPTGFSFNHGTDLGGGVWALTPAEISGLQLTGPASFFGDFDLTVRVNNAETNLSGAEIDLTDNTNFATKTLSISITQDDVPVIVQPDVKIVDETGLGSGVVSTGGTVTANFFSDAPGVFSATGVFSAATPLTSEGVAVAVTQSGNVYTGRAGAETIFTLTLNADGQYSFALTGTLDHPDATDPNDAIRLQFGVRATDSDGDSVTTTIRVDVLDDAPLARHDVNVFDVADGQTGGNVVTGLNGGSGAADTLSQDTPDRIDTVSFGGLTVAVPDTGVATLAGDHGVLTIAADGSYNYVLNPGAGTTTTTTSLSPVKADLGGGITTYTHNGITVTVADPDFPGVSRGTLTWIDTGPNLGGMGVLGNGNKKIGPAEIVTLSFADPAQAVDVVLSDLGGMTRDDIITFHVYLSDSPDGFVEVVKPLTSPTPDGVTYSFDAADFGGAEIVKIDMYSSSTTPGKVGEANFLLSDVRVDTQVDCGCGGDVFTYALQDSDGDISTATLTLDCVTSAFIVGHNVDDESGSTTSYVVGHGHETITGGDGADVLVGDAGGAAKIVDHKDYNIVMMLDTSGSMGSKTDPGSRISLLTNAVKNLMADFNAYDNGEIRVKLICFNTAGAEEFVFTATNDTDFTAAVNFLNGLTGSGFTNYEAPMQQAISWLSSTGTKAGDPITGAHTISYFVSDGEPNRYLDNSGHVQTGTAGTVMGQLNGTDGSNEIAALKALSDEVIGVGINIGSTISNLNQIDSDGLSVNVDDPRDLDAALAATNPLNRVADVGADHLVGGDGNDTIFGDALNSDALATAMGLTAQPGSGWDVFARLEAGQSAVSPGWTRADTLDYVRAHALTLSGETLDSNGAGRIGGDDTIEGGAGNDLIFGQEGHDSITGGAGNDVLYGGSGADSFLFNAATDGTDSILDFDASEGDVLDLSALLGSAGYDSVNDAINSFVFATDTAQGTVIKVDFTGSGNAAAAATIAVLDGLHGVTLDDLLTGGNLNAA